MTTSEIKEYLVMCIELEKEIYTQNSILQQLYTRIYNLGNYRTFQEPQEPNRAVDNRGVNAAVGGELLLVIGVISLVIALPISSDFFLIIGVLSLVVGGACRFFGKIVFDDDSSKAVKLYNKQVEQYKADLVNDAKRVDAERIQKAALQANYDLLRDAYVNARDHLQQLYRKNILYSKYRNYACVCTLYEYFDSGRCSTLEGHEGAYNILEQELRLNRIIVQNDKIIDSLETIKQNQELLYDSIQQANSKADRILRGCMQITNQLSDIHSQGAELNARIAKLQSTSDLNLYVNACAKRELEYINRANRIF